METRTLTATLTALALTLASLPAQDRPPSRRELDGLVKEYLALDLTTADGTARGEQILARVGDAPPPDARAFSTWKKKIQKLWRKGAELETGGDSWYWDKDPKAGTERRGRYIVGGKTRKPKGLAITMHGGGVGSGDAGSAAGAYEGALNELDLLMIAPEVLEKTECGWTDSGTEEFVLRLVDDALRTWDIDPNRVYFVGHSMGGYGSWTLGGHHADRVAAIAPSAGAPTAFRERQGGPITGLVEGVAPSLRNVFVSIYQSLDDKQVPPAPNQFAAKLLAAHQEKWGGFEHVYWEVDGRGHAGPPGGYVAQLRAVVEHARDPVPARVVWQPVLSWKRQFYWLYWQKPFANAIVVADLDRDGNAVTITCEQSTEGLYVLLDERVLDLDREVVVTVNGAETFRGEVERDLATLLRTSWHPDGELQFAARVPAFATGN